MINDKNVNKKLIENKQLMNRVIRGFKKTLTSKLILVFLAEIALTLVIYLKASLKYRPYLGDFFDYLWIPCCVVLLLAMSGVLFYFAGAPVDSIRVQRQLNEIGLTNSVGIAPELVDRGNDFLHC